MKYLITNFAKYTQHLNNENYKALQRKIKENKINGENNMFWDWKIFYSCNLFPN